MHNLLITQLIGFAAVGFTFALFQFNNRKIMLIIGMAGALLYSWHFLLLGAPTGAAMNLINIFRGSIFLKYNQRKRPAWIMYAFIAVFIISGLATWQGPISLLPMVGMTTGTIAFWQLEPRRIRLIALVAPPCWFVYNLSVGSYPGMLAEVVNVSSNSLAIYRFDIKKLGINRSLVRNLKRSTI